MSEPNSILDAIKSGIWDYEPQNLPAEGYHATSALPGTWEKVRVLAERARQGLPLWHPDDRRDLEDPAELEDFPFAPWETSLRHADA